VDFSRDAGTDVTEDAKFKIKDHFKGIAREAALQFSFKSTAEEVASAWGRGLKGRVAVVTGGNSGIGFETARVLAKQGAKVIVTVRDEKKANEAVAALKKEVPNGDVDAMVCALDSLKSVRAFAANFTARKLPLHLLILNAGIMAPPRATTEEKFESQFGVNHIGHFLLTDQLLPIVKASGPSRIVVLSSGAHWRGDVNWNDLQWEKSYDKWLAYGQSKTANILFAKQLQENLKKEGAKVTVNAVHPGVIRTNLSRSIPADEQHAMVAQPRFRFKSVGQGASTTLVAALSPDLEGNGGNYMMNCVVTPPAKYAADMDAAARLWKITVDLIAAASGGK